MEQTFKEHNLLVPEEFGVAKKELKAPEIKHENLRRYCKDL